MIAVALEEYPSSHDATHDAPPPRIVRPPYVPVKERNYAAVERGGPKSYLNAESRITWFRSEHPQGRIVTELIDGSENHALFKCTITTPEGATSTAHGHIIVQPGDRNSTTFMERAETKAIQRAIDNIGYGQEDAEHLFGRPAWADAAPGGPSRPSPAPRPAAPPRPATQRPTAPGAPTALGARARIIADPPPPDQFDYVHAPALGEKNATALGELFRRAGLDIDRYLMRVHESETAAHAAGILPEAPARYASLNDLPRPLAVRVRAYVQTALDRGADAGAG